MLPHLSLHFHLLLQFILRAATRVTLWEAGGPSASCAQAWVPRPCPAGPGPELTFPLPRCGPGHRAPVCPAPRCALTLLLRVLPSPGLHPGP